MKKHPNSLESERSISEISVWGVSDVINLIEKISILCSVNTISFPKIGKDLKTDF